MINFKNIVLLFYITVLIAGCKTKNEAVTNMIKKKPNVLLLFSDQHHKKAMGYENHPDVITSNLDMLSNESVVFDRAYCTTGICAPSRTSSMTGLYPRTLGLLNNSVATSVIDESVYMAIIFKYNNYTTYSVNIIYLEELIKVGM